MNRTHNAQKAEYSVKLSQDIGIENISIDLIYGSPLLSEVLWQKHLEKAISLNVPHISAYNLTVEPRTPLYQKVQKGTVPDVDEEKSAVYFNMLSETLTQVGFEQYEISNFALPDRYSKHNTGYWKYLPYLGIGPSAHSFDTHTRSWNTRNLNTYLTCLLKNELAVEEKESLSVQQQANEYLMLGLRTQWGVDLNAVKNKTGIDFFYEKSIEIEQFVLRNLLLIKEKNLYLTHQGKLLADYITQKLTV
jgi:oxygen-independent coproporphyrinogen-3 oxidase